MVTRQTPEPYSTLMKNPTLTLLPAPCAAKRTEQYLRKTITFGKTIGASGFVAQAHLDRGLFYKIKKRYQEASVNLEEATRIFDETGAYAFLEQAKAELASIE